MAKIFEDEFMEVQSEIVSLCLEYTESVKNPPKGLEKIYPYVSIEDDATYFDAFFVVNNEVKEKEEILGFENWHFGDLCSVFMREGLKLIDKLYKVCKNHNQRVPYEIKMCYDVKTGAFDASYAYEPVIPPDDDELMPEDLFESWIEEIKAQLKKG